MQPASRKVWWWIGRNAEQIGESQYLLSDGVIGNTSDFGSEESRFETWSDNGKPPVIAGGFFIPESYVAKPEFYLEIFLFLLNKLNLMATIPAKIQARLVEGLKRFQPIVESAKIRDVNESDTVVMLTGILSDILGFDKYSDITTELAIRGTYCDLALKIDGKVSILLEAKAVGIELKDPHVKQAVDYAANKGIEWVILTNSVTWKIYKVLFSKPIQHVLVFQFEFLQIRAKIQDDLAMLYLLSKECVAKKSLDELYVQKQATNKFMLGNILLTESVINTVRKELKSIYPDIKVSSDEIQKVLSQAVIKREILEGEDAEEAKRKITRYLKKKEKNKAEKSIVAASPDVAIDIEIKEPPLG